MVRTGILLSGIVCLIFACKPKSEHTENHSINLQLNVRCIQELAELNDYYETAFVSVFPLGDIDKDHIPDTAWAKSIVAYNSKTCKMDSQYVELTFSNSSEKITQKNAFGGIMVNAGNLGGISHSSLFYLPYWNTSNSRMATVYTHKGKWCLSGKTRLNADLIFEDKNPQKRLKSLISIDLRGQYKLKEFDWNSYEETGKIQYNTKIIKI